MNKKLLLISLIPSLLCGCTHQEVHERAYLRGMSVSGNNPKTVSMNFYNKDSEPTNVQNNSFDRILENSEVKSGKSINVEFTKNMEKFSQLYDDHIKTSETKGTIIYSGENFPNVNGYEYLNFHDIHKKFMRKE